MSRFVAGTTACGFDWLNFSPRPIDDTIRVVSRTSETDEPLPVLPFGCSDGAHALLWLLRDKRVMEDDAPIAPADLLMPCLNGGSYVAEFWETYSGERLGEYHLELSGLGSSTLCLPLPAFGTGLAITVRPRDLRPAE
jgi:hypothetical protein